MRPRKPIDQPAGEQGRLQARRAPACAPCCGRSSPASARAAFERRHGPRRTARRTSAGQTSGSSHPTACATSESATWRALRCDRGPASSQCVCDRQSAAADCQVGASLVPQQAPHAESLPVRQVDAVARPLPVDERRCGRGRSADECQQRVVESNGPMRTEMRLHPPKQRTLVITTLPGSTDERDETSSLMLWREGEPGRARTRTRACLGTASSCERLAARRRSRRAAPRALRRGRKHRWVLDRDPLEGEGKRRVCPRPRGRPLRCRGRSPATAPGEARRKKHGAIAAPSLGQLGSENLVTKPGELDGLHPR